MRSLDRGAMSVSQSRSRFAAHCYSTLPMHGTSNRGVNRWDNGGHRVKVSYADHPIQCVQLAPHCPHFTSAVVITHNIELESTTASVHPMHQKWT
ncbi:hypothetical protein EGR_09419 [Echinococcus granulosus]|uniref:Uncharacterized protein n=1 Tax=Echinococcus granulosus TaxID=6210 RepID=W6U575_ECHGR|nr:hypothetical protein EGR_09419 [Echinococcus granulosus]EUB55706.1 hypothetical protein EGR_09419 [Echinococcus granulosus]